jgi:hypothetical protein
MKQKSSLFIVVVLAAVMLSGLLSIGLTNNVFAPPNGPSKHGPEGQGPKIGHGPGCSNTDDPCPPPPPPVVCRGHGHGISNNPCGQGPNVGHGPGGNGQ